MLSQVTYIHKFIMADSEDEFMPMFVAASAAFVAMSQRICRPAGRRAGVGRPAISNIFDTAGRRRAGIGSTHDARPMPRVLELTYPMPGRCPTTSGRCKIGRPAGLVSSRLYSSNPYTNRTSKIVNSPVVIILKSCLRCRSIY